MQQVLAKEPLAHPFLEVLVGRGDHTHVGFLRRMAADAVVLAVGEHPQQAHLKVRGHVADFVQEKRAALGLFKAAATRTLCSGKGTALVAEEFGLQQVLRDGCGVDRDKRTLRTRPVPVQRTRDEFLARSRFAGDEHGRIRLRKPSDRAKHLLHRRGLS